MKQVCSYENIEGSGWHRWTLDVDHVLESTIWEGQGETEAYGTY